MSAGDVEGNEIDSAVKEKPKLISHIGNYKVGADDTEEIILNDKFEETERSHKKQQTIYTRLTPNSRKIHADVTDVDESNAVVESKLSWKDGDRGLIKELWKNSDIDDNVGALKDDVIEDGVNPLFVHNISKLNRPQNDNKIVKKSTIEKFSRAPDFHTDDRAIADDLVQIDILEHDQEEQEYDYRQQTSSSTIMTKQRVGMGGRQLPALPMKEVEKKKAKRNLSEIDKGKEKDEETKAQDIPLSKSSRNKVNSSNTNNSYIANNSNINNPSGNSSNINNNNNSNNSTYGDGNGNNNNNNNVKFASSLTEEPVKRKPSVTSKEYSQHPSIPMILWEGGGLWKIPFNGKGPAERRTLVVKRSPQPGQHARPIRVLAHGEEVEGGAVAVPVAYISFPPILCWMNPAAASSSGAREMLLMDGTYVVGGHNTPAFWKYVNRGGALPGASLCFSVVTSSRTLDLAADSPEEAGAWMKAIQMLLALLSGGKVDPIVLRNKPTWNHETVEVRLDLRTVPFSSKRSCYSSSFFVISCL